jgi:hypothetical protein
MGVIDPDLPLVDVRYRATKLKWQKCELMHMRRNESPGTTAGGR